MLKMEQNESSLRTIREMTASTGLTAKVDMPWQERG